MDFAKMAAPLDLFDLRS